MSSSINMDMFNGQITKEVYDLQYQTLLTMLENDTDKNKPKKVLNKNTGRFTKKFLDWNKEKIKEKKTFLDLSQQIYNPLTGRFSNKKYCSISLLLLMSRCVIWLCSAFKNFKSLFSDKSSFFILFW